jgi:PBS lyase HEAT-like repeat
MKLVANQFLQLFVIVFFLCLGGTLMPHGSHQSQTDIAIKKLWSPNESESADGVNELLRMGPASIEKLTSLLGELVNDQRPRFAPGSEEDGERALQEYVRDARRLYSEGGDCAETMAAKDRLTALTINSRLMTHVVHVLGELKAEQAIPLLMEMVNRHWEGSYLGLEFDTPETAALERIGVVSVPLLIENLNEATIRAYGFEPLVHGWRVVVDEDDDEADPEEELDRQTHIGNVRLRVALVLGDIGDTRALPYLEELLAEIKSSPGSPVFGTAGSLSGTIESAIGRIKKTGPWGAESNAPDPGGRRSVPTTGNDFGRRASSRKPEK